MKKKLQQSLVFLLELSEPGEIGIEDQFMLKLMEKKEEFYIRLKNLSDGYQIIKSCIKLVVCEKTC